MPRALLAHVVALTVIVTALDAVKPLHIDDAFFLAYATHVAQHPTDPYGFDVFWRQWPEPARWELCPPVLPYWLAIGVKIVGPNHPALLKLCMAPFAALLAWAVASLLRRFTDDDATTIAVLWMTMLSPVVLPGVNLMLDVPAVALAVAGVACCVRAVDAGSFPLAALAGTLAGLAGQTKYTTLITPVVMLVYAVARRRILLGAVAVACAALVFAGIESLILLRYGDGGHFLLQLQLDRADPGRGKIPKLMLLRNLPPYLGGLAPHLAVLASACAALPLTRRRIVASLVVAALAIASALVLALTGAVGALAAAFDAVTVCIVVTIAWACVHQLRSPQSTSSRRDATFLIASVVLELVATFVVSPFAAARRVIGLVIALTILCAGLIERLRRSSPDLARRALWIATTIAIITGLGYYAIDFDRATVIRDLAQEAHDYINDQPEVGTTHTVWYTGHWSFQYYAEQLGMTPVVPGTSHLAPGDWLVVPTDVDAQSIELLPRQLRVAQVIERTPQFPWLTTVPAYYLGEAPLEMSSRPTSRVLVAQVVEPFVARTDWEPSIFLTWMSRRIDAGRLPDAAVAELERWAREDPRPPVARAATQLLEKFRAQQRSGVQLNSAH